MSVRDTIAHQRGDNNLTKSLHEGDFIQSNVNYNLGSSKISISKSDDIYDSFFITVGWKMRQGFKSTQKGISNGLKSMSNLVYSFKKETKTKNNKAYSNKYFINEN